VVSAAAEVMMDWRSLMLLALFAWAWEARAAAPDPVT
jgi:sulfur-oxidizing protein SoxY